MGLICEQDLIPMVAAASVVVEVIARTARIEGCFCGPPQHIHIDRQQETACQASALRR